MTIPTIAEIRDDIIANIQTGLGLTDPLPARSTWGIIATAIAGVIAPIYRFGVWVRRQIFTSTADIDALVRRASEYGLTRTPAQEWQGTASVTGTDGTVLPAGRTFQLDGVVYQTTEAVTISGTTAVTLESLDTGDAVNPETSDVLQIVTPLTGIDKEITITSTTQTGEDAETIAAFRARILQRQQNVPQGGAIPDWIRWTTEVAGISECKVDRPAAGSITVYPLTDDTDPADRIPGGAKLTEVEDYITDDSRCPIRAAAVSVVAPTEIEFDVDISDIDPSDATTKANIEAAIEAHLYERRPKQYSDEADPRDVVSAARITQIVINAGAEVATVDLKNSGGSSITDYTLDIDELAVLGTVTWV